MFSEGDKPWHDNLVDYRWHSTRADAGLNFKLHELRNYFASAPVAQRGGKTRAAAPGMARAVRSAQPEESRRSGHHLLKI